MVLVCSSDVVFGIFSFLSSFLSIYYYSTDGIQVSVISYHVVEKTMTWLSVYELIIDSWYYLVFHYF